MPVNNFSMHDGLLFSIEKSGGVFDYLAFQYKSFEVYDAKSSFQGLKIKHYKKPGSLVVKGYSENNES